MLFCGWYPPAYPLNIGLRVMNFAQRKMGVQWNSESLSNAAPAVLMMLYLTPQVVVARLWVHRKRVRRGKSSRSFLRMAEVDLSSLQRNNHG